MVSSSMHNLMRENKTQREELFFLLHHARIACKVMDKIQTMKYGAQTCAAVNL